MICFQDGDITVTWSGWLDDVSCVAENKYALTVVHLTKVGQILDEIHTKIYIVEDNLPEGSITVSLPNNGKKVISQIA